MAQDERFEGEDVKYDEEGNPYTFDTGTQQYRLRDPDVGTASEIGSNLAQLPLAAANLPNRAMEAIGQEAPFPGMQQLEQENTQRIEQGPQSGYGTAANVAAEVGVGLLPGGLATKFGRMAIAEAGIQAAVSHSVEEAAVRVTSGVLGGAGAIAVGRGVGKVFQGGGPTIRMQAATADIMAPIQRLLANQVDSFIAKGKGTARDLGMMRNSMGPGGAGAGAARQGTRVFSEAADSATTARMLDVDLPRQGKDLLDVETGGDVANVKGDWHNFRTGEGRDFSKTGLAEPVKNMVGKRLGIQEGKFSLEAVEDARDSIGSQMGKLEDEMIALKGPVEPPAAALVKEVEEAAADASGISKAGRDTAIEAWKRTDSVSEIKEALRVVRQKIKSASGTEGGSDTRKILGQIEDDLMERLTGKMSDEAKFDYQKLRQNYSLAKTIQDNPNVYSRATGEINVKTLRNAMGKKWKGTQKGQGDDLDATLASVEAMQANTSKGSQTFDLQKGASRLGLAGFGFGLGGQ